MSNDLTSATAGPENPTHEQVLDAMRLVRHVCAVPAGRSEPVVRLLGTLRERFDAAAIRARVARGDPPVYFDLSALRWSAQASSASEAGTPVVIASEVRVDESRRTRIELFRPERPFRSSERAWLDTLHRGTSWALDADASGARTIAALVESLPPRERVTLDHLLGGASEKQVAARLRRSRHTVHTHVKRLYQRFGVNSRAELLARCLTGGS